MSDGDQAPTSVTSQDRCPRCGGTDLTVTPAVGAARGAFVECKACGQRFRAELADALAAFPPLNAAEVAARAEDGRTQKPLGWISLMDPADVAAMRVRCPRCGGARITTVVAKTATHHAASTVVSTVGESGKSPVVQSAFRWGRLGRHLLATKAISISDYDLLAVLLKVAEDVVSKEDQIQSLQEEIKAEQIEADDRVVSLRSMLEGRITAALDLARQYGDIDGDHHKKGTGETCSTERKLLWVIDQIVRALTGPDYDEFVKKGQGR